MFFEFGRLYAQGLTLEEIFYELRLKDFKISDFVESHRTEKKAGRGRAFTEDFKKIVVDRKESGYGIQTLSKELGLADSTIRRFMNRYGKSKTVVNQKDSATVVIDWDRFDKCPTCKNKHEVRKVNLTKSTIDLEKHKHCYCMKCGTEWYASSDGTRKVLWERVN